VDFSEVHPVEFVYEAPKEHSSGRARDIHTHYPAGIPGVYTAISCRSISKGNLLFTPWMNIRHPAYVAGILEGHGADQVAKDLSKDISNLAKFRDSGVREFRNS
jgi:hypothetical protein